MVLEGDFVVTLKKNETVKAATAMPEHWLPLSNLDLFVPPVSPCTFMCYKMPLDPKFTFEAMVGILKKSLAESLVVFYPFAGEMLQNKDGEPELLCNNRGVDFVEAFADVELRDLNFHNVDESIGAKFVPAKNRGVLAIQVTQLKCGGIVVTGALDHRVADAYSTYMFLHTWVETAQSKTLSQKPSFRRSVLLPRHPSHFDSVIEDICLPLSKVPPPEPDAEDAISRVYYIRAEDVSELQSLANNHEPQKPQRTKLEAFSAFLWKTLAKSVDKGDDKICRFGVVVDGRSRLGIGDEKEAALMETYCGNVVSIPFGQKTSGELKAKPLSWVADEVHGFLKPANTREHFLGLIDMVEVHRPVPVWAKIYVSRFSEEGPAVVVSNGNRFPTTKLDFGWGGSAFSSHYFPWGGQAGYVMPMPSPKGNGDWVVHMHMLKQQLDFIESDAGHVFMPLTSGYLDLDSEIPRKISSKL